MTDWGTIIKALAVLGGQGGILTPLASEERRERIAHLIATRDPSARAEFVAAAPSPKIVRSERSVASMYFE